MSEEVKSPRLIEASVSRTAGGKVNIEEYNDQNGSYSLTLSRRYQIPEDWTEEQADEFQLEVYEHLGDLVNPLDQELYEKLWNQSYHNSERDS